MKASDLRKLYLSVIHLYGFVYSKDLFNILKHYNVPYKREQILKDLQKRTLVNSSYYFVQKMKSQYLIIDPLFSDEQFQVTEFQKQEKPFYFPKSYEDLLKYSDPIYKDEEEQISYNDLYRFLKRHMREDDSRLESLVRLIIYSLKYSIGSGFNEVSEILSVFDYHFENEESLMKFASVLQKVNNNLRMPSNNGYTPNELRKLHGSIDSNNTILTIGPNMKKNFLDGVSDPYEYLNSLDDMNLSPSMKESFKQELLDIISEMEKTPKA